MRSARTQKALGYKPTDLVLGPDHPEATGSGVTTTRLVAVEPSTPPSPSEPTTIPGEAGRIPVPIQSGDQIAGTYTASGTNPDDQGEYSGEVVVASTGRREVSVSWSVLHDDWTGWGTVNDDGTLYAEYAGPFAGFGTWVLMSDGSLDGIWQGVGDTTTGTEVWRRG